MYMLTMHANKISSGGKRLIGQHPYSSLHSKIITYVNKKYFKNHMKFHAKIYLAIFSINLIKETNVRLSPDQF